MPRQARYAGSRKANPLYRLGLRSVASAECCTSPQLALLPLPASFNHGRWRTGEGRDLGSSDDDASKTLGGPSNFTIPCFFF